MVPNGACLSPATSRRGRRLPHIQRPTRLEPSTRAVTPASARTSECLTCQSRNDHALPPCRSRGGGEEAGRFLPSHLQLHLHLHLLLSSPHLSHLHAPMLPHDVGNIFPPSCGAISHGCTPYKRPPGGQIHLRCSPPSAASRGKSIAAMPIVLIHGPPFAQGCSAGSCVEREPSNSLCLSPSVPAPAAQA